MIVNRPKYLQSIENLTRAVVVKNPTVEQIAEVSPHLTREEVESLWRIAGTAHKPIYWAAPPLLVAEGYLCLGLRPTKSKPPPGEGDPSKSARSFTLAFENVRRTSESYPGGATIPSAVLTDSRPALPFADRAMAYAQQSWASDLIQDSWAGFGVVEVRNPRVLNEHGYPSLVLQVEFCLTRSWNELEEDQSAPRSDLIDAAICHPTLFRCEGAELQGHHQPRQGCNCSLCGGALWAPCCASATGNCLGCGATFKSGADYQVGWRTPLPKTLAAMLVGSTHTFEVDPEITCGFERDAWECRH